MEEREEGGKRGPEEGKGRGRSRRGEADEGGKQKVLCVGEGQAVESSGDYY